MASVRTKSAITMSALCVILVLMAWWGIHNATAPVNPDSSTTATGCSAAETSTQRFVKPSQVTVSIYNAGARKGFAALTMQRLEGRGFLAGEVANAPASVLTAPVGKARVLTTKADDAQAELVARTLGRHVQVEVTSEPLGPGVDVLVGKDMHTLNRHAPSRVKLAKPIVSCVKVS